MNTESIFNRIKSIDVPKSGYLVFREDNFCFYGKDENGNPVFMLESSRPNISPIQQETQALRFSFNKKCQLNYDNNYLERTMHVLACKERNPIKIEAFVRLTNAFRSDTIPDQYSLSKLFSSLSELFDKSHEISEMEVQGLFTELYMILYLKSFHCDISQFWQSQGKMKFDFSIGSQKRIEVKSTLRGERIHHFKHKQLLSELYDIRVVSFLLQRADFGISLGDLVENILRLYENQFSLVLHIENIISQIGNDTLYGVKYDENYLKDNIRFYDAKAIPHFTQKTPDGIFNAEYDCDLSTAPALQVNELIDWICYSEKN